MFYVVIDIHNYHFDLSLLSKIVFMLWLLFIIKFLTRYFNEFSGAGAGAIFGSVGFYAINVVYN